MLLDHLNVFFLHFHGFKSKTDILVPLNLLHTNKPHQCHRAELSNRIMHFFCLIQSLQLSKFCKDDLEHMGIFSLCSLLFSFVISSKYFCML